MTRTEARIFLEHYLTKLEDGKHVFIEPQDRLWQQALKIAILEIELRINAQGSLLKEIENYESKNVVSNIID